MKILKLAFQIVAAYVGNAVMALFGGWMLMVAVGVAHDHWIRQLPTIGYWWAFLIVFLTGRRPNPAHLAAIDEIKQRIADLKAGRLGPPTQVVEGSPR